MKCPEPTLERDLPRVEMFLSEPERKTTRKYEEFSAVRMLMSDRGRSNRFKRTRPAWKKS